MSAYILVVRFFFMTSLMVNAYLKVMTNSTLKIKD